MHHEELPTRSLIFEGCAYDLGGWDGSRTDPIQNNPVVPSLDHSIYLINTVKFRCGQIYHLFDDSEFMEMLYDYYSGDAKTKTKSLWYIHFLLILAFGKNFTQTKSQQKKLPGMSYFIKAIQILPDLSRLYSSPSISTEILCCIALFYQALDCRSPAHNYVRNITARGGSVCANAERYRLDKQCEWQWPTACTHGCRLKTWAHKPSSAVKGFGGLSMSWIDT